MIRKTVAGVVRDQGHCAWLHWSGDTVYFVANIYGHYSYYGLLPSEIYHPAIFIQSWTASAADSTWTLKAQEPIMTPLLKVLGLPTIHS